MISNYLNIECSPQCEKLLAFVYLKEPNSLFRIARRIEGRSNLAAIKLALAMNRLDPEHAQLLAARTTGSNSVLAQAPEVTK